MTQALDLVAIRAAVAGELEERGLGNRPFLEDIREGRRDDGPFMIGAIAWAKQLQMATADAEE